MLAAFVEELAWGDPARHGRRGRGPSGSEVFGRRASGVLSDGAVL
ncbi:hypothetical protein SAMN05216275_13225 [Streptosporangium canum]|uniref:Uncharacterized protein n=1 Tax=Streptosporangium canum TaxID=324952 RepID=A0A1I4BI89_9ACTN|nr:hypothetical protein SAMN05216275_13225 [Streptosporangium canum]